MDYCIEIIWPDTLSTNDFRDKQTNIRDWLHHNCSGQFKQLPIVLQGSGLHNHFTPCTISRYTFAKASDAVLFKLTWGG